MICPWTTIAGLAQPVMLSFISWTETSGRPATSYPADPSLGIIEATVTLAQLAEYEADPNYHIQISEEIIDETI